MCRPVSKIFWFCLIALSLLSSCQKTTKNIYLHYLGHSAVFLDFGHEITVLCDYGNENAYLQWGWDSPIFDAGSQPDILTYSHQHADHYDSLRTAKFTSLRLSGNIDTLIGSLQIRSIPSSEKDISRYDNFSFLFQYHNKKVLHLGDCQADIMTINDPAHAWNIEQRYPKACDILIMPIEGTQKYILKAVEMVKLLEPKVLIPTHYWSSEYKQEFINAMTRAYVKRNMNLIIDNIDSSEFIYHGEYLENTLTIPNLEPSARRVRE